MPVCTKMGWPPEITFIAFQINRDRLYKLGSSVVCCDLQNCRSGWGKHIVYNITFYSSAYQAYNLLQETWWPIFGNCILKAHKMIFVPVKLLKIFNIIILFTL